MERERHRGVLPNAQSSTTQRRRLALAQRSGPFQLIQEGEPPPKISLMRPHPGLTAQCGRVSINAHLGLN